jgi:colanic acid/amylovoran biosynthesis glycosyltransferase
MNVLYIVRSFPRLEETFVLNEIIGLIDLGHNVTILGARRGDSEITHDCIARYQLNDRFLAVGHSARRVGGPLHAASSEDAARSPRVDNADLDISLVDLARLHAIRADVIHASFADTTSLGITEALCRIFPGIPITATCRAPNIYHNSAAPSVLACRHVIERTAGIATVSEMCKKTLEVMFPGREVAVIHSAVDLSLFRRAGLKRRGIIMTVCRFAKEKGVAYLLEAMTILKKRRHEYPLELIGRGSEEPVYRQIIKRHGLGNVRILGPMRREMVKDKLERAAVFVLPSVVARDGIRDVLPNAVKEAMAMEVPVVTSRIAGIDELVEEGVSGVLVPPRSSKEIADAVEHLIEDRRLRLKMGRAGRARIEREYDIRNEVKKLERLFRQAVELT